MAKAHGLLPELPPHTVVSWARLTFRQSVQLGGQSKDAPPALSPLVLMTKRVNRAITRGIKCPMTSPGLRHDRLPLHVGACLSWLLPLSCSAMNASPICGSLITTVASKTSAGSYM